MGGEGVAFRARGRGQVDDRAFDKAFEQLSKLPDERQDELAKMLIDVAENDRLLAEGVYQLTPEQWAEVDAAIGEDDFLSVEETEAFFARLRA